MKGKCIIHISNCDAKRGLESRRPTLTTLSHHECASILHLSRPCTPRRRPASARTHGMTNAARHDQFQWAKGRQFHVIKGRLTDDDDCSCRDSLSVRLGRTQKHEALLHSFRPFTSFVAIPQSLSFVHDENDDSIAAEWGRA